MRNVMKTTRIALDGPSALTLYRDRDRNETQFKPWYSTHVHASAEANIELSEEDYNLNDEDFWLSDEDLAQTLAETHVFGKRARTTRFDESVEEHGLEPLHRTRIRSFSHCVARKRDVKQIPLDDLGVRPPSQESPLYLIVSDVDQRTNASNVHVRVYSRSLPSNAFYRLGAQVLVPTPEFTFLLLAKHLSVTELAMVGMELCGYYRLAGGGPSNLLQSSRTLYSRIPLTTTVRLTSFLERMKGFPGTDDALRACRFLEQGSASPMETVVYLLLCLPSMLGGYALEHPILNGKRAVNKCAEQITFAQYLIPDLYWPNAKLDVEYDSEAFHASPESLKNGARRTLALRSMRVEVVSLTSDIVNDAVAFDTTARLIAKRTGKRLHLKKDLFKERRDYLRSIVLGKV